MALGGKYASTDVRDLDDNYNAQFWSTTIADAIIQILGLFFLQESECPCSLNMLLIGLIGIAAFAPTLLARKADKIRKNMDAEKGNVRPVRTIYDTDERQ